MALLLILFVLFIVGYIVIPCRKEPDEDYEDNGNNADNEKTE